MSTTTSNLSDAKSGTQHKQNVIPLDPYVSNKDKLPGRFFGKQMLTNPPKSGILNDSTFQPFTTLKASEPYQPTVIKNQNAPVTTRTFVPVSPARSGYNQTFTKFESLASTRIKQNDAANTNKNKGNVKHETKINLKNFYTNPPAKGFSLTPHILIGGHEYEYLSEPYGGDKEKMKKQEQRSRSVSESRSNKDQSSRSMDSTKRTSASPLRGKSNRFMPTQPPRSGYNCTIGPFPEYSLGAIPLKVLTKQNMSHLNTKIFIPSGISTKTIATPSLQDKDIFKMSPLFDSESLQSLIIVDCQINDLQLTSLVAMILQQACRKLRYLDLSGNQIGQDQVLQLAYQSDSTVGMKILARLLVDKRVVLSSLNLSRNPIGNFGVHTLSQVIPYTSLRELILSNVNLTPSGCNCLFLSLKFAPSLIKLDISHNTLGFQVFEQLANHLKRQSFLIVLNLKCTKMCNMSLVMIGRSLRYNQTMKEMDISGNIFEKIAVETFCKDLQENRSLQRLICQDCSIPALDQFVRSAWQAQGEAIGIDEDSIKTINKSHNKSRSSQYASSIQSNSEQDGDALPYRDIRCLKNEDVTRLSPFKYREYRGWVISGVLVMILKMIFQLYSTITDITSIFDLYSTGDTVEAFIQRSSFGEEGTIWEGTDENINQYKINGWTIYISFFIGIINMAWSLAGFIDKDMRNKDVILSSDVESSIFWQIRTTIYIIVSLSVNVFRICLMVGVDIINALLSLGLSFLLWVIFYAFSIKRNQQQEIDKNKQNSEDQQPLLGKKQHLDQEDVGEGQPQQQNQKINQSKLRKVYPIQGIDQEEVNKRQRNVNNQQDEEDNYDMDNDDEQEEEEKKDYTIISILLDNSETVMTSVRGRTQFYRWTRAVPSFVLEKNGTQQSADYDESESQNSQMKESDQRKKNQEKKK
ncbi:MAG: hypothetical protein EZS28_006793 [Streblomastix strix]|uniref:Leucine Rich Repeat family protein n=1 Tax=Streblomastix strix TaxID=222440 RepID=A0A5J4WRC4_9EUKA|nr:MAG: hypothetical protein EZS28_006793 [Streblomastix strix]